MFTAEELQAAKMQFDAFQASQSRQRTAPKPQPQKKKKNFLLDQISTAGGILGGIGGSFITPFAGTAAGAGLGSALGETLENALTGESLGKNVVKEGAIGGAFGIGPFRALKAGVGAGRAALGGKSVVEGAQQAASSSIRAGAGKVVTEAGDDLLIKQFRFTPTQLKNFKGKFGEDAAQVIKRYGFKNADEVVTKGVQPLQQQFDEAITAIPGVVKDDLANAFKSKYEPLIKSGVQDNVAIGKNLQGQANTLLKKYGKVIPSEDLNTVRREFDSLVNYTERVANPARYGVNKRSADAIREAMQKSDPSGTLKGLGRELQKLNQFADNAAKQAELGRGSNPLGLGTLLGGGMGAAGGGAPGAIAGALGTAAINSPTGRRALASGAGKIGDRLAQSGARSATRGLSPRSIAGRVGGVGVLQGLGAQSESSSLNEEGVNETPYLPNGISGPLDPITKEPLGINETPFLPDGTSGPLDPLTKQPIQQSPYTRENLMADVQRDPENADKYFELFSMYDEIFNPKVEEPKPLSGEAQKRALTAQSGLRSLGTLEETLGSDPGAFQRQALPNPLGITAGLTGTTDVRAATDNVVDVIARLRSGAAITDSEAARFARFLPQPGDSQQSALRKLQHVRAELESFMNPQTGGTSLEDALMQFQGAY